MHGGTVQVKSSGEGRGAIFTLRFPLVAARAVEDYPANEWQHPYRNLQRVSQFHCPPEAYGLRVLAIDDDSDTLEIIKAVLAQCGANVRTCLSSAAALEAIKSWWPDVLVSDIAMPGEDGFALIKKVKALEQERRTRIPAMALTAYIRVEDRTRVLTAGYDMFVPKPVEPAELLATLANLVRGSRKSLSAG